MTNPGLSLSKPRSAEEWKESGVLNDFQTEELVKAGQNPILLEALEKVLCYEIGSEGVLKNNLPFDAGANFILSYVQGVGGVIGNERLGADVRALFWGVLRLKEGLHNVRNFGQGEGEKVGGNENPAI